MKVKIISLLALLLTAAVFFSVNASAIEGGYTVSLTGDKTVIAAGETLTVTLKISKITAEGGVSGGTFSITYDPDVLTFKSVSGTPDTWDIEDEYNNKTAGELTLNPVESKDGKGAVTADGKIAISVAFTVKETDKTSVTVAVTSASMTGATDYAEYKVTEGLPSVTAKISSKLDTPTGLAWEEGKPTAKWDAVENAEFYNVQLYSGGKKSGDVIKATSNSIDLTKKITAGGKYTFTVTACSSKDEFKNSDESAQSETAYNKTGKLSAPTIKLSQNATGGLYYQITDKNAEGTVSGYTITILDSKGKTVDSFNREELAGVIPTSDLIKGGTSYKATVSAITADDTVNENSATSSACTAVKAAKTISRIEYDTLPATLAYAIGDKIAISDIKIKITYDDGESIVVAYKSFASYNLECNYTNKQVLAAEDNGKPIVITLGDKTASSPALSVIEGGCKHTNTKTERTEPTCGEIGHEDVICLDCGATVSTKALAATNIHSYSDWVITANPTTTLKGMQQKTCIYCGDVVTEEIPCVSTTKNDDPPPDTSTSDDTAGPSDTTKSSSDTTSPKTHSMNDLSKIFLTIILVIFVLIILFIVIAIWSENRRAKMRRKKKKKKHHSTAAK